MSWLINIVGSPLEVIEQLHNLPVPHSQTLGGIGQFNAGRSALIAQATAARDNGMPGWAELVKASACGHVNTDGSGSMHVDLCFGFKTPLDSLAPVEIPEEKIPETAPEAPENIAPPVDNAHVAPGCEQFTAPPAPVEPAIPETVGEVAGPAVAMP